MGFNGRINDLTKSAFAGFDVPNIVCMHKGTIRFSFIQSKSYAEILQLPLMAKPTLFAKMGIHGLMELELQWLLLLFCCCRFKVKAQRDDCTHSHCEVGLLSCVFLVLICATFNYRCLRSSENKLCRY